MPCVVWVRSVSKGRVEIHDFAEDMEAVLASADVLLMLSTNESFPGSITEAMAACVLVVGTPVLVALITVQASRQ